MGVAFVSEAGVKLPCDYSMPFEHGDKFKGNTPESLACLLLGSILSGNPITVRCPECEKDTCSRCGHVPNTFSREIFARVLRARVDSSHLHIIHKYNLCNGVKV